jgi:hypothetical protein
MSGALTLQPNVSLALIAATATSIRLHASAPTTYAGAVSAALHSITSSALVLGDQRPRRLGSREFIVDACPEEIGFETDSFRNARNHVKQLR